MSDEPRSTKKMVVVAVAILAVAAIAVGIAVPLSNKENDNPGNRTTSDLVGGSTDGAPSTNGVVLEVSEAYKLTCPSTTAFFYGPYLEG